MKKFISFLKFNLFLLLTNIFFSRAYAESSGSDTGTSGSSGADTGTLSSTNLRNITLDNPLANGGVDSIPALVEKILDIALTIGVPIIALAIIYAGYQFIAAQGNKTELEKAKQTILYVIIGSGILLSAYVIATSIVDTVAAIRG